MRDRCFAAKYCHFLLLLCLLFPAANGARCDELKKFKNFLGMSFVRIEAGNFMMGSLESELYRDKSELMHKVEMTKPYYIQTTEVTVEQWVKLMGESMRISTRGPKDLPVVKVSWYDANEFIDKLNELGKNRYRLPTEAEWEFAARAGSPDAYWWGNEIKCEDAMYSNNSKKDDGCQEYIRKRGLPLDGPAPVGSYRPNPLGIYDLNGNVWEWCEDWYGPYLDVDGGTLLGKKKTNLKVRRGGSWFKYGHYTRSANRASGNPASRLKTTGFRVVMEPAETQ